MQVQGTQAVKEYSGAFDAGKKIYSKYGLNGLYKGYASTLARDGSFYGFYFMAYEIIMKFLQGDDKVVNPTYGFLAGGTTGMLSWLLTFPLDSLKSIAQTENFENRKYSNYRGMVTSVLKEQGMAKLYNGLGVCLLRSFPVNAITFAFYEMAKKELMQVVQRN